MLPNLIFKISGLNFSISTSIALVVLVVIVSFFVFALSTKQLLKSLILVLATTFAAIYGARLFHIFFERTELLSNLPHALTHFDGMTFYGTLLLAIPVFYLLIRLIFDKSLQPKLF